MANAEECREALEQLSRNMANSTGDVRKAAALDRSLTCWITDLDITFHGRLREGRIQDVTQVPGAPAEKAEIRLSMSGDDLVAMVGGPLNFASAWAGGRVKLEAGFRDLLRLRTLL
ncbi:sterol-binding protein [Kitasatospora sp. NBC_00240]|uniref:sterol-binding protein n=1 Tax=Kitasatospora sp. NBC_00240 TaxID=2903567 RepID=UPI00224EC10A|nr:sterol-binding protein [Kitasatospora sp. NBC_00240]MCX5210138.1 sterol-binding protein [Kitasatospora sp. NBC_00240]